MHLKDILADLEKDEGFSGRVYRCPTGHLTIGFGRNLEANLSIKDFEVIFNAGQMTKDQARALLAKDVNDTVEKLRKNFGPKFDTYPEEIQSVLVNMTFNMGITGVLAFKNTLKLIDEKKYKEAAKAMQNSLWYKQTGNRAKRLVGVVLSLDPNKC